MLQVEKHFAHALHLIGQELYDLLESNRTLTGVLLNKTLHRPAFIREMKKNLFLLVSRIERHVIYRLRNTVDHNKDKAIEDMISLHHQSLQLKNLIDKEYKRMGFFRYLLKPYKHWLGLLEKQTRLYAQCQNDGFLTEESLEELQAFLKKMPKVHHKTRRYCFPIWKRFLEKFFPNTIDNLFLPHLEKICSLEGSKELPPLYCLLLKKQLLTKAVNFYKEEHQESYPALFSGFEMTLALLTEIEEVIKKDQNPLTFYIEKMHTRLKVLDLDQALSHVGQFYAMGAEHLEQTKVLNRKESYSLNELSISRHSRSKKSARKKSTGPKKSKFSFSKFF